MEQFLINLPGGASVSAELVNEDFGCRVFGFRGTHYVETCISEDSEEASNVIEVGKDLQRALSIAEENSHRCCLGEDNLFSWLRTDDEKGPSGERFSL